MSTKTFQAKVNLLEGKYHVTVPELDHLELVSSDKASMHEQTRHWLALMEDIDPSSFEITYIYSDNQSSEVANWFDLLIQRFNQCDDIRICGFMHGSISECAL